MKNVVPNAAIDVDDEAHSPEPTLRPGRCSPPMRLLIVGLMFLGAFTTALSRINMTTAIIAMSSQSNHNTSSRTLPGNTTHLLHPYKAHQKADEPFCGHFEGVGHAPPGVSEHRPDFDWTETQQDNLKGAFLIGYGLALIPSGRLSEQYSATKVAAVGGFLHASINLLTPLAARQSYELLLVARVLLGIAGSTTVPAFFALITRWVLEDEKSKAIAALKVGSSLGSILLNYASGHLIVHIGWSAVFYVSGIFNLIWLLLWIMLASNRPSESDLISKGELEHISQKSSRSSSRPPSATVWLYLRMLTSTPVLATICAKLVNSWLDSLLQAKMPQYMIAVLGFDIGQTTLWNAIFNIVQFLTILFSGIIADCAVKRRCCSTTPIRKTFEGIASFGIFLSMMVLAQSDCNQPFFLAMVICTEAFSGLVTGGSSSIVVNMTTDFAGSLIAIISTITMFFGFATSHLVTLILHGHSESPASWSHVFYTTAIVYGISGLIFITIADATNQNWEESNEAELELDSEQHADESDVESRSSRATTNTNDDAH